MTQTMQALVKYAPGPGNLELREIPVPAFGDDDILMRVSFCGVCGSDLHIEDGRHPCDPPVAIGHEFSGVVAAVGRNVAGLREGDSVAFRRGWSPYPGVGGHGGFAEYLRAPARCVWPTPEGISQEEASQFETVVTPLALVRDVAQLAKGERVVVTGPGTIGLLSANIARIDGASHVTVVGGPGDEKLRLPTALAIGVDRAVLFSEDAMTALKAEAPPVWIDASGAPAAIAAAVQCVARRGRVVAAALGDGPWNVDMHRVVWDSLSLRGRWGGNIEYLDEAVDLIRGGKLRLSALITDVMPLTQWAEAFGRARRKEGIKILLDPGR